jgi:hypothetical protein
MLFIFRIDEYNAKEVKESIFLVDARESQKELIALAHCNQTPQIQISTPLNTDKVNNRFLSSIVTIDIIISIIITKYIIIIKYTIITKYIYMK